MLNFDTNGTIEKREVVAAMVKPNPQMSLSNEEFSKLEKRAMDEIISPQNGNPKFVSWDSESDPSNPLNWPEGRKWFVTILTSFGGLITLMSGPMLAPALGAIGKDLEISAADATMTMSIYVLAFAFGPMILAPCSEVWGRRPIWILGSAWYVLWNTVCGFSNSKDLLIIGRLLSGLGASAEFAVSGPIAADIWRAKDRGKSMAVRSFFPLLGPALGPIVGGVMTETTSWRWLFWVLSILDTAVLLLFIISLPETHTPTLLSRKAASLRKSTNENYCTPEDITSPTLIHRLQVGLLRPLRLLVLEPVIYLTAFLQAYQFGILYIVHSTFATLWIDRYEQPTAASGLHYLAIVVGCMIGAIGGGWATDRIWAILKKEHGGRTKPENRVPILLPGIIMLPVGLLWYGWAAQAQMHWIVPDIGIAIFGCGYMVGGTTISAYVVDAFLSHTASAGAASMFPRNIFAFGFPIFGPSLYAKLDYGFGNTLLAGIAIVVGFPATYVLWRFGEQLRAGGKGIEQN
ncbi:MFS multidrug transporter [Amniculicola lignicola CBS 123094]|uniref:MFS multidrug transporter n=1 Tax=Amniculicola lignicola CBS 123094 TaxID=1392246 RepID=A0A6A5WWG2_9PLEO|nr:MFS multidrug transporter [Amniculicola lignicola CBS 123094]